jgi:hypothetical protein
MFAPDGLAGEQVARRAEVPWTTTSWTRRSRPSSRASAGWRRPELVLGRRTFRARLSGKGSSWPWPVICAWVADERPLSPCGDLSGPGADLGGTKPLVDAVGYARALEICATGRWVEAGEARRARWPPSWYRANGWPTRWRPGAALTERARRGSAGSSSYWWVRPTVRTTSSCSPSGRPGARLARLALAMRARVILPGCRPVPAVPRARALTGRPALRTLTEQRWRSCER